MTGMKMPERSRAKSDEVNAEEVKHHFEKDVFV